jgi:agmatinase
MKRYHPLDAMVYPRFEGLRTFMRLPFVQDFQDVDAAIVGVPFDTGGTYRVGARFGPSGIRQESMLLRPYNPALKINVFEHLSVIDYGDLPVTPGYFYESHQQITEGASKVLEANVTPIFLGGDHSISWALLRAVAKKFGPVALVHFGGKDTHGTPFRRAVEEGLLNVKRSSQIGLRGPLYGPEDVSLTEEHGLMLISGPELHEIGVKETLRRVRERVGTGPAYLSFDIDFVDPTFAPGINFVAYDLVEVMPPYDVGATTCLLAANLAYEMLSLIALNKK